jgi:outer membrane receptor protein involved in Fe transport
MKVDANVQYRFNKHVNIIFAGQNLLDAADTQVDDGTRLNTGVTRAYYVKAELDF